MARVLFFSNFMKPGEITPLAAGDQRTHIYASTSPRWTRLSSYKPTKHMRLLDVLKRILNCLRLSILGMWYDVVVLENGIDGLFLAAFVWPFRRPIIIVSSYNVPRRRQGFLRRIYSFILPRINRMVVHSSYEVEHDANLMGLSTRQFTFMPFCRDQLATSSEGGADREVIRNDGFCLSLGGNARDYQTLIRSISDESFTTVIVCRQYNLAGLDVPDNVTAVFNVSMSTCDVLTQRCRCMVVALDGSEPACGHITIVSAIMAGKPVICTDVPGVRDYVIPGVNGILVPIGDASAMQAAVRAVMTDDETFSKLSSGASEFAKKNQQIEGQRRRFDDLVTQLLASQ